MTRPRATTSPSDALGATIADLKARLARLENIAHQHNTPASDFVRRAGDTMTGELILPGDPVNNLGAATKQYVDVASPVGTVLDYVGAAAPTNWALLNGQTLTNAQTIYPSLWAVAPTAWRSGSNLVLPNLRGRVTLGAGQGSGLTNRALGSSGGAETHTLTVAQMPAHNHTGVTGQGNSKFYRIVQGTGVGTAANHQPGWAAQTFIDRNNAQWNNADHTHNFTTANRGGGGAHNNMQPFYALNKIIKIR